MRIIPVAPHDEPALRAWYAVYERSQLHERPWGTPWRLGELGPELWDSSSRRSFTAHAGVVAGTVVSAGSLTLPLLDNLNSALVAVDTEPARRGRGHGSTMLAHLEDLARAAGRRLLTAEAAYPYDAPPDGSGHPDVDFLTRRGYVLGLGDVQRVLELPVADSLLDRLSAETAPHHASYRIEAFSGAVPEELLASFAAISASLMTEAPVGTMEREPESADPAVVRESEALRLRQGRQAHTTVAVDAAGEVAAFTSVMSFVHEAGTCFQWGTVVRRGDRGHRLGLAVKVANLRLLRRADAGLRRIYTFNAEVNTHMVAINDTLGFRPIERLGEFQKAR